MWFSKTEGVRIDTLDHDLNSQFPYYFPEDIYNKADQLEQIKTVFWDKAPEDKEPDDERAVMYVSQLAINSRS